MKFESRRPRLHFTPETGWINDPNGLCYDGEKYHLFAQYYEETQWGPMHWCHAVSEDLVNWEHLPVALAPDSLGMIFSGSAVCQKTEDGKTSIAAIYTSHGEHEQQSLAFSCDGINFQKHQGNPVIKNCDKPDFRDPKVFWNPIRDCWGLVLAAGDHVEFFASSDLKDWEKTGEFGPGGNYSKGVWECPDIFPLSIDGRQIWVLLVSMGANRDNFGSRTQYFTGSFDGDKFISDSRFTAPEFIDEGFDNYAAVSFYGAGERIIMGWASNWDYAGKLPTEEYRGQMTLARTLRLENTETGGLRLACAPVIGGAFSEYRPCDGKLSGDVFKLRARGAGECRIVLENGAKEQLCFGVDSENRVFLDRSRAGESDFDETFSAYSRSAAERFSDGPWEMELVMDRTVCELFADQGLRAFTDLVFPSEPYDRVRIEGEASLEIGDLAE
mgnify:CR=1 FL=1